MSNYRVSEETHILPLPLLIPSAFAIIYYYKPHFSFFLGFHSVFLWRAIHPSNFILPPSAINLISVQFRTFSISRFAVLKPGKENSHFGVGETFSQF